MNHIQGFFINIKSFSVVALCATLFAASGVRAELIDRVEAIVNKKAIYYSDVARFKKLISLRVKVDPLFANDPISKKQSLQPSEVVDFLVNEQIILEKFPVSDSDVEQEINGIQANLRIDRDTLRGAILREGFKFDDYHQLMRVSLAKRQLIDREIRNKASVSEDDLNAELNRSQAGSKTFRGSFHLYLIQIFKEDFKSAALAKAEAQKALEALSEGTKFEEVAKKFNRDESDGDLGFLSYGDMSKRLQEEVRKLAPKKHSNVFDNDQSFSIVWVADIKSNDSSGNSKEKEALRAKLLETEFQHQIQLWLDRQRALNFIKINHRKP